MKTLILISFLLATFSTFAVDVTTIQKDVSIGKSSTFRDKFDLEFVLTTEQTKDTETHEVHGLYTSLKNSLVFSPTKNDDFRLYASRVWESYDEQEPAAYWELAEVMYRRKNILREEDHFVSMEVELKNYKVMDTKMKSRWGFSGAFIPQAIFKKSFNRQAGMQIKLRRHYFDRNRLSAGTLTKEDRVYVSGYYMFNRWFMTNVEMKYRHKMYTGDHFSYRKFAFEKENVEITTIHPSLMFFVSRNALVEVYAETVLNESHDKRSRSNIMKDEQVYGAALYLTAF